MKWYTQVGNVTTNLKVKIEFTLFELSTTKLVTCHCHMDNASKGRYNIILGRDILAALQLNLKFSWHVIEADDGFLKMSSPPMVDLDTYEFKYLNTGVNLPK